MDSGTLCEKYQVSTYTELRSRIWALGTSPNGVFGCKHSWHTTRYERIANELRELRGDQVPHETTPAELLADFFPDCTHIFLTRRNKIRQAVSWWKAIKDNVWHLEAGREHKEEEAFYEQQYDFDALRHLFQETMLREAAMQAVFSASGITPMTLVYEDLVSDYQGTIMNILEHLKTTYTRLPTLEKSYGKTSSDQSEKWVQRFRKDLQNNMDIAVW
jgi:LPS sulfotransferase NodH